MVTGAVLHHPGAIFAMGVLRCMIRVCYVGRTPMLRSCWETCCRHSEVCQIHHCIHGLRFSHGYLFWWEAMYRTLGCSGGILASSTDLSTPPLPMQDIKFFSEMVPTPSIDPPRNAKNSGMICFQDHLLGIAVGHTYFFFEEGWRWSEWVLVSCARIDWIVKEWKFEFCCAVPLHSAQDVYPLLPTSKGFRLFRTPRLLKMVGKPKKC